MTNMNETEIRMYSAICSHDGIKAREIAKETGTDKTQINRLLYSAPFIRELCYVDDEFCWHGMIRQSRPHIGLGDFCGYYATVDRFLDQPCQVLRAVFMAYAQQDQQSGPDGRLDLAVNADGGGRNSLDNASHGAKITNLLHAFGPAMRFSCTTRHPHPRVLHAYWLARPFLCSKNVW